MGRKTADSAVLEPPKTAAKGPKVITLPIEYKGRHCPKLSRADFWAATQTYIEAHPENASVTCYKLYRLFPVIDRKLSGEELKDIANERHMDESWILSRFGHGEYQVFFIDGNARPSSLCSTVVEVGDLWENPPILNQIELVEGATKNKGYIEGLKARGLWKRDELKEEKQEMAAVGEAVGAATEAVKEMAGIAKGAMAKANEKTPADAALGQVVEMFGTAYKSALSTIGESGGNKSGGEIMLIVKMMQDQQTRQHEIFMEMLRQQGSRPAAPAASIDGQLSVVTKMLEFARTLGGGESRPTSFLDQLAPFAPALLALLTRASAPAPAVSLPMVSATGAPVAPSPAPVVAPPAAPVSPEEDPMFAQVLASMGVPPEAIPFAKVLAKVGGRAVQMFRAGVTGYAFAADVERTEGEDTYGMIHAAGLSQLVELLTRFAPMLGAENAALIGSAQFHNWLNDFFHYGNQNGYVEESGDEPPAGADVAGAE